jgi:hypothetical protein
VRVVGLNGQTLLPQTQVTTSTASIPVGGGSCSGTSAGGALYDAIQGNWEAKSVSAGIEIDGVEALDFPALSENPGIYWAFWLNNAYAEHGACDEQIESNNEDIVFVAQCYAVGADCSTATAPDHFLTSTAPSARVVNVGESVSMTIASLSTESGTNEPSLPTGVLVSGASQSVVPGAGGVATVSFASAGTYTLQAQAPDSVPSDPFTVCVHNGNDGNCGTSSPSGSSTSTGSSTTSTSITAALPYKGPFALVAGVKGLTDGHVYPGGTAPRVLSGNVVAHTAVSSVSLRLRREYRGRCSAFDGATERFRRARCGSGAFFKVASNGVFSYQLPTALAPGRYVLDVEASDAAGNRTTLARGSSRIVFYVR